MRNGITAITLLALAACAPRRPVVAPGPTAADRLAAADAELRAGCLDCLLSAYAHYDALRQAPDVEDQATAGAVRAAALIAMRERELGMVDEGYLAKAQALADGSARVPAWLPRVLDIADALPGSRQGGRPPASDADLARRRLLREHHDAWLGVLRGAAQYDEAAAYAWLVFTCDVDDNRPMRPLEIFDAVSAFEDTPLIVYRESTCRTIESRTLELRLEEDPRFVEIAFSLGLASIAARPQPKLDDAERWFQRAYAWRPKWPALTLAMGGVAMTAEEFDRARAMYEETLALDPRSGDALFGDLRALTYLGAAENAIAAADRMIAERWSVGDARYWRAYNELQLNRLDAAWEDVELAEKTSINAQIPKLAGLIAYRRAQLDVAIARFSTSYERDPLDCETRFYLGVVHAELRQWIDTADRLVGAASCLQEQEAGLTQDITRIRASNLSETRKAAQIARREQQIVEGRRRIATSWFDIAVADFNLSKKDEARQYAEKVSDDEQFGERARELLARLR